MILCLLAVQALPQPVVEPPLIFAGERFTISLGHAEVQFFSEQNVLGSGRRGKYSGVVERPAPAVVWTALRGEGDRVTDAAEVRLPAALAPRWRQWPLRSGTFDGISFLIGRSTRIAAVATESNVGIVVSRGALETRWGAIVLLEVAVRSGPARLRPFRPDYVYAGTSHLTLIAAPEGVARIAVTIFEDSARLEMSAGYEMAGSVTFLGERREVNLTKGQRLQMEAPLGRMAFRPTKAHLTAEKELGLAGLR